jgi:hypothetical protein
MLARPTVLPGVWGSGGVSCLGHQFTLDDLVPLVEHKVVFGCVHADVDRVPFGELAAQDAAGQRVLDPLLDDALERPRAVLRVVAFVGQQLAGVVVDRPSAAAARWSSPRPPSATTVPIDPTAASAPMPARNRRRCITWLPSRPNPH